jgi:transposase-like protein
MYMKNAFSGLNILEFTERFSTDEKCLMYLSEVKWEIVYKCGNCSHTKYYTGHKPGSRVCASCKYFESATARTMFHKLKFSLRKAFHIIYVMSCGKKGMSSYELSRQLGMRQKTCWYFQKKIRGSMGNESKKLLTGQVEVDEFFVGGPEEGNTGRGNEKKPLVAIAIQTDNFGIQKCYAKVVENAGSDELSAFLVENVEKDTMVRTDKWSGYKPSAKAYNLVQESSAKGKTHKLVHRQIMMIKAWLRGIHHKCRHLQNYLNEYCYRFNKLKNTKSIFQSLLKQMVVTPPIIFKRKGYN